ncbi:tetratricopeptide repeat protein [Haloferula sp.]|uniref:tetratricopeptide repeat protein n=1 Tax=Haloferula sp. TaxID=2497595 RepID=UPI003C712FC3
MTVSFPIDDLRKSVPEASTLDGLTGDELITALRRMLGKLADGANITVDAGIVTLDFDEIPSTRIAEAERLYPKAVTRAAKGEFPKAASIYRRVLELDPTRQDARRELAMVLFEVGKADDAVDTLLDVLKTEPRDSQALVILGNHYARQDSHRDTALKLIQRACELTPDDATVHNSLGGLLLEGDEPDQAIEEFNHAIRLDPKLANAYYGRSMVEMNAQRWSEARDSLQAMFETATSRKAVCAACSKPHGTTTSKSPTSLPTTGRANRSRHPRNSRPWPKLLQASRSPSTGNSSVALYAL